MTLLILIFSLPIVIALTLMFLEWSYHDHQFARIKYSVFRKLYRRYPHRWKCYRHDVYYMATSGYNESLYFGFIGYCRYRLWRYKIHLTERRKKQKASLGRMWDDVNKTGAQDD